jgi:23S rRNA pseudouridine1911/1915/1917 synthase
MTKGSGPTVIYHDNHLLAASKPAGLLTQPAPDGCRPSLEEQLRLYVKELKNKPGNVFLHAAHRLDREASGLVLCALTGKALARLNEQMRRRQVQRTYHALVSGLPEPTAATLCHWHRHGNHQAEISPAPRPGFQECRLSYTTLRTHHDITLLEIRLDTGRYHQIRAQLAALGFPILGDARYGSPVIIPDAIRLHCSTMICTHPVGGQLLTLTAPLPGHWELSPIDPERAELSGAAAGSPGSAVF